MTTSSVMDSGVMDFGEALALAEAALTLSGTTFLVEGVPEEAHALARGAVHRVAEAMAELVPMVDHGAPAEEAGADHGVAL